MRLVRSGLRCGKKRLLSCMIFFLVTGCLLAVHTCRAGAEKGGDPSAKGFILNAVVKGDSVRVADYGIKDMEAMPQAQMIYSSVDSMPAPNIILARGVLLDDFLKRANIEAGSVLSISLYSADGWSHSYSAAYLLHTQRYYFPGIIGGWVESRDGRPVFLADTGDDRVPVQPVLALKSFQERFCKEPDWSRITSDEAVRFFFGQSDVDEMTNAEFGRFINRMDVVLKDGSPLVSLAVPSQGQYFKPGDKIAFSGSAINLVSLTMDITGPDGLSAAHFNDIRVADNIFSADFDLGDNAPEGEYTVTIGNKEKPGSYKATFKIKVSKADIAEAGGAGSEDFPADTGKPGTEGSGSVGVPSDTLTVKAGYFGGPYTVKKVFTLSDLSLLPEVRQAYTFIDNMPAVVVDSARGVKLTDILISAGIDINSAEEFYFYATDVKKGWYECLPASYLFSTERYYYPNLPAHWDSDTQSAAPEAKEGAVPVEPIIAFEDNWKRFATEPDFSVMHSDTRFRLLFGQSDTTTRTASRSVKWVHAIEVMLGGAPPAGVVLNEDTLNIKVGSTFQLSATVKGPDKTTDKRVVWSSSNPEIAKVDSKGMVEVLRDGTAAITVTTVVGGRTDVCVVNPPAKGEAILNIAASDTGAQNGGEQGTVSGAQPPDTGGRLLADENSADGDSGMERSTSHQGGSQPWRIYEMSPDAVPMPLPKRENGFNALVAGIAFILLLTGSCIRYKEYARDVRKQ